MRNINKDIKYLLNVMNEKSFGYALKASLVIDYIIKNKIDIVSYGDKYLFTNEKIEYEELLPKLLQLKNSGYFDEYCFSDSELARLMERYAKLYDIIYSDESYLYIANELLSLGVSSESFRNDYYNLHLLIGCDKRLEDFKKILWSYTLLYNKIRKIEKDGIFDLAKRINENDYANGIVLEFIRGDFVFIDSFLAFKNITLDNFNALVDRVRENNSNLYNDYMKKRKSNDKKIQDLIDGYIVIYKIVYSKIKNISIVNKLLSLNISSKEFEDKYHCLTSLSSDSRYNIYKHYLKAYDTILNKIKGYEKQGLFETAIRNKAMKEKNFSLLYECMINLFGFDKTTAKCIARNNIFYNYNINISSLQDFIYFLNIYGFDKKSINKMVKKNNGLILKNNVEIYNTFSILQSFGFNKNSIILICSNDPFIFDLSRDDIIKFVSIISYFDYSADNIRKILINISDLRKISFDTIESSFTVFNSFNYSQDDIIRITSACPNLLCESSESLSIRLKLYRDFGLDNLLFECDNMFGFNMDIKCLYSRIMYYKDCGVSISLRNINLILSDSNCFRNCINKSDTELSKRYPLPIQYCLSNTGIKRKKSK